MITARPLVSKREILETYRPGREPADTLFRSLRNNKLVSDGLQVTLPQAGGRLGGSVRIYCALSKDAARLARQGQSDEARALARVANRIEGSRPVKQLLAMIEETVRAEPVANTEDALASVFRHLIGRRRDLWKSMAELTTRIEKERAASKALASQLSFYGVVARIGAEGTVEIVEDRGSRRVMLPLAELAEQGLGQLGDAVAIHWESFGRGRVLTEAEPALRLDPTDYRPFLDSRLELDADDLAALLDEEPTVEIRQPLLTARP